MMQRRRGMGSIDWASVPWYAMPVVGVDAAVMAGYCLVNPNGTGCRSSATFPTPPAAAAPGAPQTITQMTVPGAYTPEQSAADSHDNSLTAWNAFFNTVPSDPSYAAGGSCWYSSLNPMCDGVPAWVWIFGVGAVGLMLYGKVFGGSRRR